MNVLVTGGAGFIGSNFILEAIEQKKFNTIVNLDVLTYAGNLENLADIQEHPSYHFVKGSIGDASLVQKTLEQYQIDTIVHFAAESHVDRSITNPSIFLETNVLGTFTLLEAAKKYWAGNKKCMFLHVSTDEVYGSLGKDGLFTETTPYQPNSPYSASKASSDHLVRSYHHTFGLPVMVTNCSNNYGPYQFPEKLVPLIIHNIKENKALPIYGDGMNIRDWLYVRDHCKGILTVLEKGRVGEHYNIGGHNEWANINIVKLICELMDKKLGRSKPSTSLITYVKDRPGHDKRYAIDATKIKQELGWVPAETFETGIDKTIDWYLSHDAWLNNVTSGQYQKYYQGMYANR